MKRIGIVGGVGWQSTLEYYAGLCRLSEQRRASKKARNGPLTPEICIESLDLNTAAALLGRIGNEKSWRGFDEYHRTALKRLQASDAEVAAIASNTAHHRLASIIGGIGIPVLSILDAAAKEAARIGATRVLILGTALTMQSKMYPDTFRRYGIEAIPPTDANVRTAVIDIISEIHRERIAGAAARIHTIAEAHFGRQAPDGTAVCLACTELPLAFPSAKESPSFTENGTRYINTSAAHIQALFDFACA
ncbi:MAG TPA: aspartate/glutamate racemase family protein [Terracidiphilus sp.]|nr:aspartate/glutamate racemase family protein [Terracidiphilus sp.]